MAEVTFHKNKEGLALIYGRFIAAVLLRQWFP